MAEGLGAMVRRASGTGWWRLVAVVSVVGLVGAGWVPAASGDGEPECSGVAADAGAAAVMAAACGIEVEILAERTEWETAWALPEGGTRLEVTALASRTVVDDEWVEVDPSLVAVAEGISVVAPVVGMVFSDGTAGVPLARLTRDGHELVVDVPFELPVPVVEGARLTYPQVADGVDLVVTVNADATGFAEVLVVESAAAAAGVVAAGLDFELGVSDGLELVEVGGGFVAEADGERVFGAPPVVMWDSGPAVMGRFAGPLEDGQEQDLFVAPAPGSAVAEVGVELAGGVLSLVPDESMVTDPGTVWPVYIDPTVDGSMVHRTAVRDVVAWGSKFNFTGPEGLGLCDKGQDGACTQTSRSRLLWQFNNLQDVGARAPEEILSATFTVEGAHSWSCEPRPVTLYRVGNFDASTVWPGGGLWDPIDTRWVAHRAGCAGGNHPRDIAFNAVAQAKAIAAAGTSVGSLGLQADESSMDNWKRYTHNATFKVTYNQAPSRPTEAETLDPHSECVWNVTRPYLASTTPVMRARISDPDKDILRARFELYHVSSGARLWRWEDENQWQSSGTVFSKRLEPGLVSEGVVYQWRVYAVDPSGAWGPWEKCEFIVDLSDPAMPTVTPVAGNPGFYPENEVSGAPGRAGQFRFASASSDVTKFVYSFNNSDLVESKAGSPVVVPFTPTSYGTTTLRVRAVDRAGRLSPMRTYVFYVGLPKVWAAWPLDEGQGSVAREVPAPTGRAAHDLALMPANPDLQPAWVAGPAGGPDRGLRFSNLTQHVRSQGPVVAMNESFSVLAIVRLKEIPEGSATAVSQNGQVSSGFSLGYRQHSSCPGDLSGCWSFFMYPSDAHVAPVQAAVDLPVSAGVWMVLAGVYDKGSQTISAYACELDTAMRNQAATPLPFTPWLATGSFVIGRGQANGASARAWPGEVAGVRLYSDALTHSTISQACGSGL